MSENPGKSEKGKDGSKKGIPQGIVPLFMATKTQEIFQCIVDEHVTEEEPLKVLKKEDIISDMKTRAAISDFHPVKQIVLDYPSDELLISYDPDFEHGQNFFLCINEEAKAQFLHPEPEEGVAEEEAKEAEAVDETVHVYSPPEAKEWVDQGGAAEVACEMVVDTRPKIRYCASRVRKEFGASFKFGDRDADPAAAGEQGLSASYLVCNPYPEQNFNITKLELDLAIQAVPEMVDGCSQTEWKHPVNAAVQYEARSVGEDEAEKMQESKDLADVIREAAPRFELAMQQNVIIDVFFNDWLVLGEEDTNFGSKSDSHLKEYQSFTDLEYSKDKTISYVDWHPQIKGVMGVACCERFTFDERIDNANRLLMDPSLILLWSFTDPIHPQLLLEGPDDITCFQFCPTNPDIIAGGCVNGQLVMWDMKKHADKINSSRGSGINSNQKKAAMFGEEVQPEIPTVRYCAVSSIEGSHRNMVSSLQWVPSHFEFNRLGMAVENRNNECSQIVTCGVDGNVMVWDIRVPKATGPTTGKEQKNAQTPFGISEVFKHLDLKWKPLLKLSMPKTDSSGDYSPLNFSMPERQGVRDHVPAPSMGRQEPGEHGIPKIPSAKNQKLLEEISSRYFIGTEDGEVVYCDFKLEKDNETGKLNVHKPSWSAAPHDGPIRSLQRNPFFRDVILSVGGWSFSLWKEGILNSAILQSSCASKIYTAAHWSMTRPAVFFLGTKTGNVEVWDLLDRTHEAILSQNVTAAQITHIVPCIVSRKQHLLGVADNVGTLHILEIPWNLRHPAANEEQAVLAYLDREAKRIEYFLDRKPPKVAKQVKKKSTLSKQETDEAVAEECEAQFGSYLKLEKKLLQDLGLLPEEKEV